MRHLGQPRDVADRPDVGRVADEDGDCVRCPAEAVLHRGRTHTDRKAGRCVEVRPEPDRLEPSEDETEEHRTVERAPDEDPVALRTDGQCERLVRMGGPADGEAAHIGTPQESGSRLRVGEHAARQLHRVEAPVERDVSGDDVTDEVGPLLVPGNREGRGRLLVEAQPGVEEGCVATQPPRISRHRTPPRATRRP